MVTVEGAVISEVGHPHSVSLTHIPYNHGQYAWFIMIMHHSQFPTHPLEHYYHRSRHHSWLLFKIHAQQPTIRIALSMNRATTTTSQEANQGQTAIPTLMATRTEITTTTLTLDNLEHLVTINAWTMIPHLMPTAPKTSTHNNQHTHNHTTMWPPPPVLQVIELTNGAILQTQAL